MRYQERIYIQNQNSAVRNRNFNNFNTSSDICIFNNPSYYISGATKLDCTGSTSGATYIISANTETIPLIFNFTANTQTFLDTEAKFKYEIYKYDNELDQFNSIPTYRSDILNYSAFSATNITTQLIPSSGLTLDGEYIIKSYYQYSACTQILKLLGKNIDTLTYKYGTEYGIYDNNLDYYFIAIKTAEKPIFSDNGTNDSPKTSLQQAAYLPEGGINVIPIPTGIANRLIITLNGLVLAENLDYSVDYVNNIATLSGETVDGDVISFIYATIGGPTLSTDNISINTPIVSGTTNNEGNNVVYFNTTTGKYEVYLTTIPAIGTKILLMLNGATLVNNIDFYQSTSNSKRLILEGELIVDDILTIVYFPQNGTSNNINTNNPIVSWYVTTPPTTNNGYFSIEVSTANTFTNIYYTGYTEYIPSVNVYTDSFPASGEVGTKLYYRVKNQKNYETICGNLVSTYVYSDIIPVTILSNSINSY